MMTGSPDRVNPESPSFRAYHGTGAGIESGLGDKKSYALSADTTTGGDWPGTCATGNKDVHRTLLL